MTDLNKASQEFWLTQAQYDTRKNAGTLVVGAIYHITDVSYATKVSSPTSGDFAGLDANGNLTDSGKKASDFATAAQGTLAESAVLFTSQSLTDPQKLQARTNIGAGSTITIEILEAGDT